MSKQFCDEIIKEFSQEGDTVLDPFFGLGTTGLSCIQLGRNFIGFEKHPVYCELANKRINDDVQLKLEI